MDTLLSKVLYKYLKIWLICNTWVTFHCWGVSRQLTERKQTKKIVEKNDCCCWTGTQPVHICKYWCSKQMIGCAQGQHALYLQFSISEIYVAKANRPLQASWKPQPCKHEKPLRALTPLTKQVIESTITQFRGSQALGPRWDVKVLHAVIGESLFCKGKANDWVFGGIQLLDLCAFKRLCYFTALWSKLISASYVNENWYSSLCSYSFLIPIIDWNF